VNPGPGCSDKAFSVIIPTFNRAASLRRVLGGLCCQEYPADLTEVVVVSDGGTDGSAQMARSLHPRFSLKVFEQPHQGPSAARNLGLRHATGPFVLFLDDDVIPAACLIAAHAEAHGTASDRVVVGPLLPAVPPRSPWGRWESRTLREQYEAMTAGRWSIGPRQFFTGNASVRLDHVRRVGGFDVGLRRAEDVELGLRLSSLGLQFVFCGGAIADHLANRSFAAWLRGAYEYGRADVAMGTARGRPINEWVVREFYQRHPYTQRLVRWGLVHRSAAAALAPGAYLAARAALIVGQPALAHALCSGMFNLKFWCGVSDALGGRSAAERILGVDAETASVERRVPT